MSRILYWNIENFGLNKIHHPNARKRQRGASMTMAQGSNGRRNYILAHLGITDAGGVIQPPDIIVVVEIETAFRGVGQLVQGAGGTGAQALLTDIRVSTGNANWMLVPPLQTGPNEAVAVFYDSTNYFFTGPWQWPGGNGPSFNPAIMPALPIADYAAPYLNLLPPRPLPAGVPNAGLSERRVAAATGFTVRAGLPAAGGPIAYGAARVPYMVSFAQMAAGAVARNLTLFAIHAPARVFLAANYLTGLAAVAEITDHLGANEARVVLGDFNVNLMTLVMARNAPYANLTVAPANYTLGIDVPGLPPAPIDGYSGYFATHIKRGKTATYWTTAAQTDYYPGYGYIGSSLLQNFYAIDNILARYGAGAGGPMANVTVLNGIVGSSYGIVAAPPGGPPMGTYNLPIGMGNAVQFGAPAAAAPAFSTGRRAAFNGWNNYGRIRSSSDHLAIVADV